MRQLFLLYYNFIEDFFYLMRIKYYLKKNIVLKKPIIFDIGAHKGKMVKLFHSLYKNSKIHCFEPNQSTFKYLKNIRNKDIVASAYALGDKNQIKKLSVNKIDLTSSLSKINKKSIYLKIKNFIIGEETNIISQNVKVITLDHYCNKNKINRIDLIKIDVEGYEHKVLLGAKKIIKNVKFLIIEFQNTNLYDRNSKKKIDEFLKKNNFKLIKSFNFPLMFFQDRIYVKMN